MSRRVERLMRQGSLLPSTLACPLVSIASAGKFSGRQPILSTKIAFTSRGAAVCMRWNGPIREIIIGRGMSVFRQHFCGRADLLQAQGALALLDEPASEHGCRAFVNPLIKKRRNFLAEIGGMVEPREFKALQRVAGSREKELPRGLSFAMVHARLLVAGAGTLTLRYLRSIVPMGH